MAEQFDVFLAHHSADKPLVQQINTKLKEKEKELKTWIDEEQIPPGTFFQDAIEKAIPLVKTAAIILGKDGIGRWQKSEIRAFYTQLTNENKPVIPVLLPGLDEIPEPLLFLKELRWIKFETIEDENSLELLIWGITGKKPQQNLPDSPSPDNNTEIIQPIQPSSFDADAYYNRAVAKHRLGDKQGAITDYNQAAQLYLEQNKIDDYKKTLKRMESLKEDNSLLTLFIKNKKSIFISCFTLLSIISIYSILFPNHPCENTPDFISCGEKPSFPNYSEETPHVKKRQEGTEFFKDKNYKEAVKSLTQAWKKEKDPTTLIALNNAKVMNDLKDGTIPSSNVFYIAISTGFTETPKEISGSILTGVAWRQKELNDQNIFKVIVVMGDDKNNQDGALEVAKEFGKRKQILGVIGPYSSKVTSYVINEYFNQKVVLIAPTSTASIEYIKDFFKKLDETHFSWFFRPISTTRIGAKKLINYLRDNHYKNLKIFFQDNDLFGLSFYKDFYKEYENLKSEMKIIPNDIKYLEVDKKEIENEIDTLKKSDQNKHQTALVIMADAYTTEDSRTKKKDLVKAINGTFFIAGNNTLFDKNIFDIVSKNKNKQPLVVALPWYPSDNQRNKFADFIGIKKTNVPYQPWSIDSPQLTWHMAMSYDATQMLIHSIEQQRLKNKNPTREGIQNELASSDFKTEGLSGRITLNKSDRKEEIYSLISVKCSSTPCNWQEIK